MADANRFKTVLVAHELEHEFARQVSLPVEDRLRLGLSREQPAAGAYRWFRSENVVDLEVVRHLKQQGRL